MVAPAGAVATYAADALADLRRNLTGARAGEPDAVHDARVAVRRLRATLRTFRPLVADSTSDLSEPVQAQPITDPVRVELRAVGAVLGELRDVQVMGDRLAGAVAAEPPELVLGPVAARIASHAAEQAAQAQAALVAKLDDPNLEELLAEVDRLIRTGLSAPADDARLLLLARRTLRRADRRLAGATTDPELHEARKAYKSARYAVEAVAPIGGGPAGRLTRRLKRLQDLLGEHQDTVVTRDVLRQLGVRAHQQGENAFTYGLLHARQAELAHRQLARLHRAELRAARVSVRRWLG